MNVSPVIPFRSTEPFVDPSQEKKVNIVSYSSPALEQDVFEKSESVAASNAKVTSLIAALLGILAINSATVSAKLEPQPTPALERRYVEAKREDSEEDDFYTEPDDNEDEGNKIGPREVFIIEPGTLNLTTFENAATAETSNFTSTDSKDSDYKTEAAAGVDIKTESLHPYFITTFNLSNPANKKAAPQTLEKKAALINELVADYNKIDLEEDDDATIKAKERAALKAAKEALKRTSQFDLPRAKEVYESFLTMDGDNYSNEYEMTYGEATAIQARLISELERKVSDLEALVQGITEDIA